MGTAYTGLNKQAIGFTGGAIHGSFITHIFTPPLPLKIIKNPHGLKELLTYSGIVLYLKKLYI